MNEDLKSNKYKLIHKNIHFRDLNPENCLFLFLLMYTLINIFIAYITEIHFDEAYYWAYSKSLDWGYFDHPPMIAFLIRIGAFIDMELGVRFVSIVLNSVWVFWFYNIIKRDDWKLKEVLIYIMRALQNAPQSLFLSHFLTF